MAEKDVLEKRILQRPEIFAEVFNLFVFGGRDVIKAEYLQNISPAHRRDDGRWREMTRDVMKKYRDPVKGNTYYLGIENQEYHAEDMAVRIMGLNWNCYKEQFENNFIKYIHPVYTLVLNWRDYRWTEPHDLTDKFDPVEIDESPELIMGYPIKVIDMMFLDKEVIMKMKTELKQICMVLISRSDRNELDRLLKDPEYEHLSVEAADLIAIKLNLQMPFKEEEREKGEINMCRAWEEIKQDEFNKGIEKGAAMQKAKDEAEKAAMKEENTAVRAENSKLLEENRKLRMRLKMLEAG